ncbi:MAG: hypothetical protein KAT37_02400 [Candidatus Aenigmarchaeota archaeon]|nr:hypothetical protein [Candidatus Aenigmarchaeota archaeon]
MKLQVFDADYTMLNDKPLIRIFCKDSSGKNFCVFVNDYMPYFYAMGNEEEIKNKLKKFEGEIQKVEKVKKFLPVGYQEKKTEVLKITNKTPSKVPVIRDDLGCRVFEADILFKYRFFSDRDIKGMHWIDVEENFVKTNTVSCVGIETKKIKPIINEENVPMKIMAIDIETEAPMDRMPEPEKDAITMISFSFSEKYKNYEDLVVVSKHVLLRNDQKKNTICTENEKKMLERLKDIINGYDPDIITGYNIQNFDMPFIVGRMEKLNIKRDFGRAKDKNVFCSKYGPTSTTKIIGRIIADSYQIIRKDFSFKSYKLDNVAEKLIGKKKIDINYRDFNKMWNGSNENLQKFIDYSRKDATLALELIEKKNLLDKYVALSRVSGILFQDALNGGESIRIENILLSEFNKRDTIFPVKPTDRDIIERTKKRKESGLTGGLVLEPQAGLHTDGYILVLDFKSLYPSIIRTYNICPTTLLQKDLKTGYNESPVGTKFVKSDVKKGILPHVLEKLINQRSNVKKKMFKEKNLDKKRTLYAEQWALKILANAFYGYTGYLRAKTYVMEVANTITAFGRELLQRTRDEISNMGYEVIYGDTDSVFVKVKIHDLDKAYEKGNEIVGKIKMPGKLVLEFEKTFRSFLILTKKRYAAWSFEKNDGEWSDRIEMKGIETVRRDWPDIVTDTMNVVINVILKEGDIKKAIRFVQGEVDKLNTGTVDLKRLAVTKSITKGIDRYDGILPHIELARKLRARNPSQPPVSGSRISYVIIRGNQMLSKRAEDPEYINEHNLKIDSYYYIENQLLPPLERIFAVIGVDKGELMGKGRQCNLKDMLKPMDRNHKIDMPPEGMTIDSPEGFVCRECKNNFRRVPLLGRCECGGEIMAFGNGSMGGLVKVKY